MLACAVVSPGCWMLTNIALPSGVSHRPVISQPDRADQEALQRRRGRRLADVGVHRQRAAGGAAVAQRLLRAVAHLAGQRRPASCSWSRRCRRRRRSGSSRCRWTRLNTRPSGLEKSWSPVRLDRLIDARRGADSAPNRYTSQVKLVAAAAGSTFLDAQDVAVRVALLRRRSALDVGVDARVGAVGRELRRAGRLDAAVAVVGQREVDLAVGRVHAAPLRAGPSSWRRRRRRRGASSRRRRPGRRTA